MSFLDDMTSLLVAGSVGTVGVNILAGSAGFIPEGPGPFLAIIETGGMAPTRVQNSRTPNTQRPTAQIVVYAGKVQGLQEAYTAARAMASAAYYVLDGNFNVTIGG